MTRNLLLSAMVLVAVTICPSSAVPQTKAAPTAATVVLPSEVASGSALEDHHAGRHGSAHGPHGYPWS